MALINLQDVTLSYGGLPILEKVNMQIDAKERVCLIGRNGEGKSSLMKLISEEVEADSGQIIRQQGLRVSRLRQQVPKTISGTIFDVVACGLGDLHELLSQHHSISHELNTDSSPALLARLEEIHHRLDTGGGWQAQQQVETVLSRLQLAPDTPFDELSGGLKRRVLLAQALVGEPDLLLLDEPTNHLDIESITWLEEFLINYKSALLFVTHDRALLRHLATRIIELDRGQATSWPGDYDTYLRRKAQMLEVETDQRAKFDKKLANEEIWIRKGIKARRTRDEGRVRALMEMRCEHAARREQAGKARMQLMEAGLSGKLVVEAKNASFSFAGKPILKDVSTTILRGDKIGIIGPNGIGKTTLLRLLLGELSQQDGSIKLGANLAPVYFDQHRNVLDEEKSVADNVSDGNDTVVINDRPKHIIGYLQDFLFAPDRARSPVKILSGGERNRLLLAKLFAKPSNVLILDEPTNDLDVETLDLLEEIILNYKGTVLLVSHDRAFLNNVVTSTLVFEGDGVVSEYAGGYDDWLIQRKPPEDANKINVKEKDKGQTKKSAIRKLTFKEKKELTTLPKQIEELESEQENIFSIMAAPDFYQRDKSDISKSKNRLAELEQQLPKLYKRWEELEAITEQENS